jgi:hypothetical protein
MKRIFHKKLVKGFSLAEILLSVGIFAILSSSVMFFAIDSIRANKNSSLKTTSSLYFQEYFNALMDNKDFLWGSLVDNTDKGQKSLQYQNERYQIVDGSQTKDGMKLYFTVNNIYRDTQGNIVTSGGTLDQHSRQINLTSEWVDILNSPVSYSSAIYVNDWNTLDIKQTTNTDFLAGTLNDIIITNNIDGEVQLGYIIFPDWCRPTLAISEFDLPGSAVSKTIFATAAGKAYLGTAGTSSTISMTKLNIQGVDTPSIAVEGTFAGYKVNNVFVAGNYAYLATTNTSKEVVIVDISHTPYAEVGYFNATGSTVANSVYVVGNVGYVATGKKVQTFNLTANTGSRAKLGEVTMLLNPIPGATSSAIISQIVVVNNYIYASLWDDYDELAIANATNPASMTLTSSTSVNNQQTLDIFVNSTGTRAYFGTTASSSEREFFILNTTSKTNPTVIGRYDSNGMNVDGIAIIDADKRAILVGNGGEEYQAVDITTETAPTRCGGMQLNSGIFDIDSVLDTQGNAFSYIVTGDTTKEFKILRGGPGSGHEDGYGFPATGEYISSAIDSTSTTSRYYTVQWTASIPTGTALKIQLRSGTSLSDLNTQTFIGPDGTASTYFTSQEPTVIPASLSGKQYIQYKVFFESDTFQTPILSDIKFNYQK